MAFSVSDILGIRK